MFPQPENFGFNVHNRTFVAMYKEGIIDYAKVTIRAIFNATSMSALFIITKYSIIKKEGNKDELNI